MTAREAPAIFGMEDTMIRASATTVRPGLNFVSEFGSAQIDGNPPVTKYGTTQDDILVGFGGDDTLYGLAGNDTLDGGAGKDLMAGGTGDDTYYVDNLGDVIWEWGGQGTDWVFASVDNYTLAVAVEHLVLIGSAIAGSGNQLDNYIEGNAADNALYGMAGHDVLSGGAGNDVMVGGTGNDFYYVEDLGDIVWEWGNEGTDTILASFSYTLDVTVENLELKEAAFGYSSGWFDGTGNELNNVITGNSGNNKLTGLGGDDTLRGGDGHDTLIGGAGNDILDGGLGFDSMSGGTGDDIYYVDAVFNNDKVFELAGEGIDTVRATFNYRMDANVENMQLIGVLGHDGWGNEVGNTIWGSEFDNIIRSRAGDDTLFGYVGMDILDGGTGNDILFGGTGDDILEGGLGFDIMNGEAGADTFTFRSHLESLFGTQEDQLPDFSAAEGDKIDLSAIDASTAAGEQAFGFIGTNVAFNGVAGELRFNASYVEGDIDGNGIADFRIAVNASSMVAADFVL
jgi:Ca2+-binding RTX toxin-like protein